MTTLYHGCTEIIDRPRTDAGRPGLDFGQGFYTTRLEPQAQRWAQRAAIQRLAAAIVCQYEFDDEKAGKKYRKLKFEAYDRDWLEFIVKCRGGLDPSQEYDYIEGGVANDRVIDTVEGYINGTIDAGHALIELSKHQPNHQMCFLNQSLIDDCLVYKSYQLC